MIPVLERLQGVFGMLGAKEDWRERFDVSPSGYWESFFAALLAAPLFALSIMGQNTVSLALAETPDAARPMGVPHAILAYLIYWAHFPVVARIFVHFFDREDEYAPWVVVHNWTLLVLQGLQGSIGLLLMLGLLSPRAYLNMGTTYVLFAMFAHSRVALGALGRPYPVALGGACLAILISIIIQLLLVHTFRGAALQL